MAEIHVQAKKHQHSSPAWIWIVVVLLIAAAVIYFLSTRNNNTNQNNQQNQNHTTSGIALPQPAGSFSYVRSAV